MVPRPLARTFALALVLCTAFAACGRSERRPPGALAPATGLPAAFTPVEWTTTTSNPPSTGTTAGDASRERCALMLRDDRDGTRLQLMRSQSTTGTSQHGDTTVTRYGATGDYAVSPSGKYGVAPTQWLRVECGTWRGLGIVARSM
jgi:hypothetical protein